MHYSRAMIRYLHAMLFFQFLHSYNDEIRMKFLIRAYPARCARPAADDHYYHNVSNVTT